MSYILVIVESPAKCNKIESYLGEGYKCVASFGHIRELADGLKSIDVVNNFQPTFKECDDKKMQIFKLRKLIESAREVLLGSDDDREGEAISWHICQVFGLPVKTTKRIIFHEITEKALKRAVAEATILNMNVVNAQLSRQVLDVLVGYNLSPVLWKHISKNKKNGLSAGRCQTPAMRLVYENQKEIEASPGRKAYTTTGYFTAHNLPFILDTEIEGETEMSAFLEASVNFEHMYSCGPIRNTIKESPSPFTTSTLQQTASNEMRISPKETMKLCQTLYEAGYITYMRTDSNTYSEEFVDNASKYIDKIYGKAYVHINIKRLTDPKRNCAHEAIRPTDITHKELDKNLGAKEIKMYNLIHKNTLESCMSPAIYNGFTAISSAPAIPSADGGMKPEYRYSIEQAVFKGWKIVGGVEENNKEYTYLQALAKSSSVQVQALAKSSSVQVQALAKSSSVQVQALANSRKETNILKYKKITSKVTMKDLKAHLGEAKLVQLMEQKGIGRPSTFASLIDKIQERGYVKLQNVKGIILKCTDYELEGDELSEIEVDREFGNEKNKLVIQPTGILVLEFLLDHFDALFQYDYTKHMESSLDIIAKGDKLWYELCRECLEQIYTLINELKVENKNKIKNPEEVNDNSSKLSIRVDNNHTYIIGKHGPVLKYESSSSAATAVAVSFKPVREDIDIEKLKRGEYKLEDLVVENKLTGHLLGMYDNKEVYLKNGKFGYYVEYGEIKKAIRIGLKQPTEVTLDDVVEVLFDSTSDQAFSRVIDDNLSIRNGKFGDYIFYKTKTMKKPKFFKLKGFKEDYKTCELSILIKWIKDTQTLSP